MPQVVELINIHHCFVADPETLDIKDLSRLTHPGSFALEDFDIGKGDFDAMPDRPPDFVEGGCLCPFISIARQRTKGTEGEHSFWLHRLKTSGITRLADVAEDQLEDFVMRWSSNFIYNYMPFSGVPKDISREEAERQNRREVVSKIRAFLTFFCPFCRQALAVGNGIYVLWERHEYWEQPGAS